MWPSRAVNSPHSTEQKEQNKVKKQYYISEKLSTQKLQNPEQKYQRWTKLQKCNSANQTFYVNIN